MDEKFQLEAARIVTGLPSYASRYALYFETGWGTLKSRREKRKLNLMYEIQHNIAPDYLRELVPPLVRENNDYNLRNNENINIPPCRLNIYRKSFVPSTISLWNNLPIDVRNSTNINQFKKRLDEHDNEPSSRPSYFSYGNRKTNVIHTRLRHRCSQLHSDLHRINLVSDPSCRCGFPNENAIHFFLECNLYSNYRLDLFRKIRETTASPSIDVILYGDSDKPYDDNIKMFRAVHNFISQTKRFD
ncbi:hypothetical protein FSP39_016077 [Pinctada imbricata]|uniref:Uncharacterized protein n=1 Tax=Pinctada imbricata TaxID=66713 RepID=A0AA88XWU0_PINIB|nr:hypothetical protein FSP39_016077 [Pinctada imbricata]